MIGCSVSRRRFPALLAAAVPAFVFSALILALCLPGGAEKKTPLAEKDGWAVARGAPDCAGLTVTVPRSQWLQGALMLASAVHPLPQDYPPPEVRSVRAMVGGYLPAADRVSLRADVIYALCAMQCDHSLTGQVFISGGAVSAAQQEALRREAFTRYAMVYPVTEAVQRAAAAVPGGNESEHQTGWSVDIDLSGPLSMKESNPLCRNEAGKWMAENLWRYGFVQREGVCENIHLRYVGPVHAAAMRVLGMNLEEYLAFLRGEGKVTLLREERPYAYLLCFPADGAVSFSVPERTAYAVSGDNTGFVVIAIAAQNDF